MKKNIKIEDLFDGYENRQHYQLVNKALELGLVIEEFVDLFNKIKEEHGIQDMTGEGYLFRLRKFRMKKGVKIPNLLCKRITDSCQQIVLNDTCFKDIESVITAIESEQKWMQNIAAYKKCKPIHIHRWQVEDKLDCIALFANYTIYSQSKGSFLTIINIK